MYSKKTLLAAAALAVLSAAGSASAAPWDHGVDHGVNHGVNHDADHRMDHRNFDNRGFDRHPGLAMHRHYVDRIRIDQALRFHNFRVIGDPYFLRGHYVVRTHDRFGRLVVVEVDPYTGAFLEVFPHLAG